MAISRSLLDFVVVFCLNKNIIILCFSTVEQKAFEIYQASLTPLTSTFPCDEENIMKKHEQGMKEAIEIFRKETLMDSDIENFGANLKVFTVLIYPCYFLKVYIIITYTCACL